MRLGIDFDNTIVSYDALFHRVALEEGRIPSDLPANKSEVRNYLRRAGREEVWTEMQGRIYGARMSEAIPCPGVLEFFRACRHQALPVCIISHKTRRPFLGEPHDLHQAALDWLDAHGFFDAQDLGMSRDCVFFELTKEAKLARIAACSCTHFVDDLPEFLQESLFPPGVDRILFDPHGAYASEVSKTGITRAETWTEIAGALGVVVSPAETSAKKDGPEVSPPHRILSQVEHSFVAGAFEQWAARGGSSIMLPGVLQAVPLPGGANNRVWRVTVGDQDLVLKRYFHKPGDRRDRFGAERRFYEWAWQQGVRCLPEAFGWDAKERLALIQYVAGRKLRPEEVTASTVDQAIDFVLDINARRHDPESASIALAAEACFSLAEHLECIRVRLERLTHLEPRSTEDHEAVAFIRDELVPAWQETRAAIDAQVATQTDAVLPVSERCLSPSDFGFHNALLPEDGRLRFFDFEYAGWDDPAKLICDFFCQPEIPVPLAHWQRVVRRMDEGLALGGTVAGRAAMLLPGYRLKWCCILLNEFLRDSLERRAFAQGVEDDAGRKRRQLAKARAALRQRQDCEGGSSWR